jgi:integrase
MSDKIWIEKTGKTLRLRWNYEGKKQALSLGVTDNPVGKAFAAKKMAEISMDLISGHYDPTLLKYKPRKLGTNPTEISAVELFKRHLTNYKQARSLTHCSEVKLNGIASKLQGFVGDLAASKVTDAVAKTVVSQWLESASNTTVKEYLYHLKGCWDWAKDKYSVADPNPWDDSLTRSRSRDNNRVPKQPKPFTIAEFQAIVSAFTNHPQYSHYTDFVLFLANSACRPGEAAGLRWKHLGVDYATAWIGESISRRTQKGTKTGKARTIQLNPVLKQILISRYERLEPQADDLVFPSPKGVAIDDHNFCNRAWKTILTSCHIEYRTPYNLRHSAISHALAQGANPIALAEQTGHDKRVLLSTYAHAIDREVLFVSINDRNLEDR